MMSTIGLHTQFIGKIVDLKVEEGFTTAKGHPDIEKIDPIAFAPGVSTYHRIGEVIGEAFKIGKKET